MARAALARVGIESLAERPYTQISGGQRQLALIARALADGPPETTMTPDHLAHLYRIEAWLARLGERRFCVPERVLTDGSAAFGRMRKESA